VFATSPADDVRARPAPSRNLRSRDARAGPEDVAPRTTRSNVHTVSVADVAAKPSGLPFPASHRGRAITHRSTSSCCFNNTAGIAGVPASFSEARDSVDATCRCAGAASTSAAVLPADADRRRRSAHRQHQHVDGFWARSPAREPHTASRSAAKISVKDSPRPDHLLSTHAPPVRERWCAGPHRTGSCSTRALLFGAGSEASRRRAARAHVGRDSAPRESTRQGFGLVDEDLRKRHAAPRECSATRPTLPREAPPSSSKPCLLSGGSVLVGADASEIDRLVRRRPPTTS